MAKKRANGEGNIRKRKDGRWEGRYTAGHDPETGKPIYKNVLGRTQAETKAKLKAAIEETKSLDVTKAGKVHGGAWMDEWFENYAKVKVRPSSHQTYRGYIDNHIKPNIGKMPLEKLTSLELQKALQEAADQRPRIDRSREQAPGQGFESQDRAEHPPDHRLGHEAGEGAATDRHRSQPKAVPCPSWSTRRCRPYPSSSWRPSCGKPRTAACSSCTTWSWPRD